MDIIFYPQFANETDLSSLSAKEQDLFFYIVARLKYNRELSLRAEEIKNLLSATNNLTYKEAENICLSLVKNFPHEMRHMFDVLQVDYVNSDNTEFDGMTIFLFDKYQESFVEWHQSALDLDEFRKQSSIYTKTLFRLLYTSRFIGIYTIKLEWLANHLGLSDKNWTQINRLAISPSIPRISNTFENLKTTKKDDMITFSFKPHRRKKLPNDYFKLKEIHHKLTKDIGRKLISNQTLDEDYLLDLAEIETKMLEIS